MASFPLIEEILPRFMGNIDMVVDGYQQGQLNDWEEFKALVFRLATEKLISAMDQKINGWEEMCSDPRMETYVHVTAVFVSLLTASEYMTLSEERRALMKWIVLFHDIGKKFELGKRDLVHPYPSAAITARNLSNLGFPIGTTNFMYFADWQQKLSNAAVEVDGEMIPDKSKLPEILSGVTYLFGHNTSTALVIKSVLLHQSLNVLKDFPQAAPLTDEEIKSYVDAELFPLLSLIHLVDSDAWQLYDAEKRGPYRDEIFANLSRAWHLIK